MRGPLFHKLIRVVLFPCKYANTLGKELHALILQIVRFCRNILNSFMTDLNYTQSSIGGLIEERCLYTPKQSEGGSIAQLVFKDTFFVWVSYLLYETLSN